MLRPCSFPISLNRCIRAQSIDRIGCYLSLQAACLHTNIVPKPGILRVPSPRPDIPDVKTFLERIGRSAAEECGDKIGTWEELFTADGAALKKKDIPVRLRRYILLQTEKYRNGEQIVHIRRGRKVNGGERRRNTGPTRSKIGR